MQVFTFLQDTIDTVKALPQRKMIGEHPSYHEAITGKEAEHVLRKESSHCYLTRYSIIQKSYVLSVHKKNSKKEIMMHFKIIIEDNGQYLLEGKEHRFNNIGDLLKYYEENRVDPCLRNIGQGCKYQEYLQKSNCKQQ